MGRHTKSGSNTRLKTRQINFRIEDEIYLGVQARAAEAGLTTTAYVRLGVERDLQSGSPPRGRATRLQAPDLPPGLVDLARSVAVQSGLLIQLAKALRLAGDYATHRDAEDALRDCRATLAIVRARLGDQP